MSEAAPPAVVAVRDATLADLEFLVEGNAAMALETENLTLNKDTLRQGCAAMLNDRSKGFYLMADCEGVTAGQLMVTYEHSDWRNGTLYLHLAPLPAFAGGCFFELLHKAAYTVIEAFGAELFAQAVHENGEGKGRGSGRFAKYDFQGKESLQGLQQTRIATLHFQYFFASLTKQQIFGIVILQYIEYQPG